MSLHCTALHCAIQCTVVNMEQCTVQDSAQCTVVEQCYILSSEVEGLDADCRVIRGEGGVDTTEGSPAYPVPL